MSTHLTDEEREALAVLEETMAERVKWDDGTEYIAVVDAAKVLAAQLAACAAQSLREVEVPQRRTLQQDATWALESPDLWESPDERSIPALLAGIGQTLADIRADRIGGQR